jgi:hypothetical protein
MTSPIGAFPFHAQTNKIEERERESERESEQEVMEENILMGRL